MSDRCPDCAHPLSSTVIEHRLVLACVGCRTWFPPHELAALRRRPGGVIAGYTPQLLLPAPVTPGLSADTMSHQTDDRPPVPFAPRERRS